MPRLSTKQKGERIAQLSLEIGSWRNTLYKFVKNRDKAEQKIRREITSREEEMHRLMR